MSDLVTEAPITDEELAEAIRVRGYQVPNGVKVLQLILDHIPPETRRIPWNGQQDYYRNIPQPMRHQFLERLYAIGAEPRSNAVPSSRSALTARIRTWPPSLVR